MDLKGYYQKIRETEQQLSGDCLVVVSVATSEGGKAGLRTEVPRGVAARMLVEGRVRAATEDEALEYREEVAAAKARYDQEEAARRMQVMVIPAPDLRKPKERS